MNKITSTNEYAKKYFFNFNNIYWITIIANNQIQGLGKKGNWYSEKHKNVTISIIFNPINFNINKKYFINNIIVSNAIHKVISKNNMNNIFFIKWPNDIIANNKKISGILIENLCSYNKIRTIIIGIGLNVEQKKFYSKLNAISLNQIFNKKISIFTIIKNIIYAIQLEYYFYFFKNKEVKNYYIKNLFLKNIISKFYIVKEKKYIKGIIKNITNQGLLILNIEKKNYHFSNKEIKFLI